MKHFVVTLFLTLFTMPTLLAEKGNSFAQKMASETMSFKQKEKLIDALTAAQIPQDCKSRREDKSNESLGRIIFYRGGVKVCEVTWLKSWKGEKKNDCMGQVFYGGKVVGSFATVNGVNSASSVNTPKGYTVSFLAFVDKSVQFTLSDDKGFYQSVLVDGRKSRLLNDLQYTKDLYKHTLMNKFIEKIKPGEGGEKAEPHKDLSFLDKLKTYVEKLSDNEKLKFKVELDGVELWLPSSMFELRDGSPLCLPLDGKAEIRHKTDNYRGEEVNVILLEVGEKGGFKQWGGEGVSLGKLRKMMEVNQKLKNPRLIMVIDEKSSPKMELFLLLKRYKHKLQVVQSNR